MRKTFVIALLAAQLVAPLPAPAAVTYRAGEGWSAEPPEGEAAARAKSAADQMLKSEEYERAGDTKKALDSYRYLLKKWPRTQVAPRAQLKIATLSEKTGDLNRAFDAYGQYISKYQHGDDFDLAVESQFRIARLFLDGRKQKMLGVLPITVAPSRAQEMFEQIVKNAPFSKIAPQAQFNIGRALEKQGKTPEAIAAYQAVLIKYPGDPVAADAQYQIGYIHFQDSRSSADRSSANKAREAFDDFATKYPESEKIAQAKDNLKLLSGRESRGNLDIAKFYDKQKNYRAACIYYSDVLKLQPGTPDAETAQKRIDELKNLVGEDALRSAPERAETGKRASEHRRLQAKVDAASRPDYVGPPVVVPDEVAPDKSPKLRTTPGEIGPVPAVEPPLPKQ